MTPQTERCPRMTRSEREEYVKEILEKSPQPRRASPGEFVRWETYTDLLDAYNQLLTAYTNLLYSHWYIKEDGKVHPIERGSFSKHGTQE